MLKGEKMYIVCIGCGVMDEEEIYWLTDDSDTRWKKGRANAKRFSLLSTAILKLYGHVGSMPKIKPCYVLILQDEK